jgi:hypothetical protein
MVPRNRIEDAKAAMRARWHEAVENPEGEPVRRRDRWKVWLVIGLVLGMNGYAFWLGSVQTQAPVYEVRVGRVETFFAAPNDLAIEDQEAVVLDYCLDNPSHRVVAPGSDYGKTTECADVLIRN